MIKRFFLFSLFLSISLFTFSQQLRHVLLSTNGKARYEISAGNPLLIINDSGKIQSIEMEPLGDIMYDKNTFPHKFGEQNLEFNYDGRLIKIGSTIIQYDLNMNEIKKFSRIIDASIELSISYSCIKDVLKGKQKSSKGFIFMYSNI